MTENREKALGELHALLDTVEGITKPFYAQHESTSAIVFALLDVADAIRELKKDVDYQASKVPQTEFKP